MGIKNPFIRNKVSMQERITKTATKVADKLVGRKLKGKTFDQKASITRRLVSMVGVPEMRNRVLAGMREDIEDCVKKGMTDEEILQPAIDSLNYKALLAELDLNFDHLREIIKEVRDETSK